MRKLSLAIAMALVLGLPVQSLGQDNNATETKKEAKAKKEEAKGKSGWSKKDRLEFQSADGDFTLRLGLIGQVEFTAVDPSDGDQTTSTRIRRARPDFRGTLFGSVGYRLQYEVAGSPNLLDFYLNWGPSTSKLQAGQFKAPFGRQELTSIAKQAFIDRSIASKRFAPSRQQGLAILGKSGNSKFEYGVGIFNGNGRNRSSDDNDAHMFAGRVLFSPLGSYDLDETPLDYPSSARFSIGFSGMVNTEDVGVDEVDVTRTGAEMAFKLKGISATGEYYAESADAITGATTDTNGYYAQFAYLFPNKKFGVALRQGAIMPDVSGPSRDQTEAGVAFNFFRDGHGQQFQIEYLQVEFDADPSRDTDQVRVQAQIVF